METSFFVTSKNISTPLFRFPVPAMRLAQTSRQDHCYRIAQTYEKTVKFQPLYVVSFLFLTPDVVKPSQIVVKCAGTACLIYLPMAARNPVMTPVKSKFWKGWSPSGIARACISAALTSAPCITWRPKFWIIPWMRRLPDMPIGLKLWLRIITPSASVITGAAFRLTRIRKFPDKSALEVILTTLHAGGKFSGKAYQTSGGLHGVGASVVNALSSRLEVEVAREKTLYKQSFVRGKPAGPVEVVGKASNRRGTLIRFSPDEDIFGAGCRFKPELLYRMALSKAYLFAGVEIRWQCAAELISEAHPVPAAGTALFSGRAGRLSEPFHRR